MANENDENKACICPVHVKTPIKLEIEYHVSCKQMCEKHEPEPKPKP